MAQTMQNRMLNLRDSLRHFIRLITGDRKGASAVMTALMLPVIVGFVGLAIDVGVWQVNKRKLQGVVDQAVFSAAMAAYQGASVDQATTEAKAVMAQAGLVPGANGVAVTVSNPATDGNYTANAKSWQVTATMTQQLYFSGLFLSTAPTLSAKAVALQGYTTAGATVTNPGPGCVMALSTTAAKAVEFTNNAVFNTPSCSIYSNSNASNATFCDNNCNVNANTYSVGNYYIGNGNAHMTGTNLANQTAIANPYGSLTTPDVSGMSCMNGNTTVTATADNVYINPGRYCKGINFSNNTGSGVGGTRTLHMSAGTYYVESIFMVGNNATLDATTGVTIVIIGNYCIGDTNNTCQHSDEGWGNNAQINLTAPTTGTYAGVAMYFTGSTNRTQAFANNAYLHIQGTLYAPNQKLQFNNNSYFDNTKCTKIIGNTVSIQNNGGVSMSCTGTGVKTIGDTTTVTVGSTVATSMVE